MSRVKLLPEGVKQRPETLEKSRMFVAILYEDCQEHMQLLAYLQAFPNIYQEVAYIRHDRDIWTEEDEAENPEHKAGMLKKAHFHVYFKQIERQTVTSIQKYFAPFLCGHSETIQVCRSAVGSICYFLHMTPDSMNKARYSVDELVAPDSLKRLVIGQNSHFIQFRQLFDVLDESGGSIRELLLAASKDDFTLSLVARFQALFTEESKRAYADYISRNK